MTIEQLQPASGNRIWHGITRYHLLVFLGCWLGGIFDGMDSNLFSVMLPDAISEICHTTDKRVISQVGSVITFVFLIGWMCGGILFGIIGDRLGRVRSMMFSILLYALFTGAAGLAQTTWQLALFRFLTGLGIGGELVSISTLLSESWPERSRAIAVGTLITSYQTGVLLSGIITNTSLDWRQVFLIGALPALLTIFIRLRLREPDKWHEAKTQAPQDEPAWSLLKQIFHSRYRRNLIVGSVAFGALLIGYWASLAWIPAWIHDLLGPQHQGTEKSVAVIYHGVAAIIGCVLSGISANRLGRKPTIVISFLGSLVASALLFLTNPVFSPIIYWQDALLGFFIGMNQAVMYIYLPELFPTRLRATAVGFCLNVGRFSSALAALSVGTLVAFFGGYAQAAFAFAIPYAIGLVAVLFGTETKSRALPD